MAAPKTRKQWTVEGKDGFDSLQYKDDAPISPPGDNEVLVQIQGASLNYRDLIIPKGKYPFPTSPSVIAGSDGAGTVVSVGKNVKRFKEGDKVLTLFNQRHQAGKPDAGAMASGLGGAISGTFTSWQNFDEDGVVQMPKNLNFVEASTLSCAGLTAWNAFYGLGGEAQLKPGDWVLTQGTGGVSIFGLQFAKAAGAKVVSTTSSDDKAKVLRDLGADHVINYKSTPEWGQVAKDLTPNKRGFDHILEVAGPRSMKQSLTAIAMGGVISVIGFLGGVPKEGQPGFLDVLTHVCTVRGVFVGPKTQLEDMCRAIEANGLKPVVDKQTFPLEKLKEAYQYMWDQKHFGKVCIDIKP